MTNKESNGRVNFNWNEESVKLITELWQQGISASKIGAQLGITKNAVIGKVHRLGLVNRPSPIAKKKKKPQISSVYELLLKDKNSAVAIMSLSSVSCRWPIGDPKSSNFKFCDHKAQGQKPYCLEHYISSRVLSNRNKKTDSSDARK